MNRTLWIVGVLLLIGTFIGAGMVYQHAPVSANGGRGNADVGPPKEVYSLGFFEVEKGVALLYPSQFGRVVDVKAEDAKVKVKQGDVLLQIDDAIPALKVREAAQDIKAGEVQLEEAKQLTRLYQLQKDQQVSAIKAIDSEIEKTKSERASKLDTLDKTSRLYENVVSLYKFALEQLAEKKKSEEARLKQIELQDADLKIRQAEADLEAKKIRWEMAKELVKLHQLTAPSDGYVLRVYVHKGEVLGPSPRIHAIEFLPDAPVIVRAEVLQEWARFVKEGQEVTIEDDTYKGPEWKGKVKDIKGWFAPTRTPVIEPFRYNDVRTLECVIELTGTEQKQKPIIGQRVRAKIKVNP